MAVQQRRVPRQRANGEIRRRGAVYGIPTVAVDAAGMPIPGTVIVGYIGKTRQTVKQREGQHREDQPFSDLIVGGSWVIEEGFWTDEELSAREKWYIRNGAALMPGQKPQRPVYNYEHNLDNPHRIEVWRAREHRQARQPGWQPVVKVPRQRGAGRPVVSAASRSWLARWWLRRRWWVIRFGSAWVVLFAAVLWLVWPVAVGADVAAAAFWATSPFALVQGAIWYHRTRAWWRRTIRPKRRRRRR